MGTFRCLEADLDPLAWQDEPVMHALLNTLGTEGITVRLNIEGWHPLGIMGTGFKLGSNIKGKITANKTD